jgi:hypothetical protein
MPIKKLKNQKKFNGVALYLTPDSTMYSAYAKLEKVEAWNFYALRVSPILVKNPPILEEWRFALVQYIEKVLNDFDSGKLTENDDIPNYAIFQRNPVLTTTQERKMAVNRLKELRAFQVSPVIDWNLAKKIAAEILLTKKDTEK